VPGFSIVIPAHNEAAVIERCLGAILTGAPAGEPEILVVCNGCTDDTAVRARRFDSRVRVIELAQGSKPLALNAGNEATGALPRFFVDADIVVSYASLAAAAEALRTDAPRAAAPAAKIDASRAGPLVQLYCSIWRKLPYLREHQIGAGVYGLNSAGLKRIGAFPNVIGDDQYVYEKFALGERISVARDSAGRPAEFTMFSPRTINDLVNIEARRRAGDDEIRALLGHRQTTLRGHLKGLTLLALRPWLWPALAVFLYVKIESRRRFHAQKRLGTNQRWARDESSRGV
jgi:glycosyltransferase involved in cell wall biosynthesis